MNILQKYKLYVKPKDDNAWAVLDYTNPRNYVIYVLLPDGEVPLNPDGEEQVIKTTVLRSCQVFVDLENGTPENAWDIRRLNGPGSDIFISFYGDEPTLMTVEFRIYVGKSKRKYKTKEKEEERYRYNRMLPDFMCPYWRAGLRLIAVRAANENLMCKILNKDFEKPRYYVCLPRARIRAQKVLKAVQAAFISENAYSDKMTVAEIKKNYIVDIFEDSCTEVENHLVFTVKAEPKWSYTRNLLSVSAELVRRLPRFTRGDTTTVTFWPGARVYNGSKSPDGGKNHGNKRQKQGKPGNTETSDDNRTSDFRNLPGGGS